MLLTLLWMTLAALGGEGDAMKPTWVQTDATARPWDGGAIPGAEAWVVTQGQRSSGVLREGDRSLSGVEAFRRAIELAGATDPTLVAGLAMLFVEPGTAGQAPWTAVSGSRALPQQQRAQPPRFVGDEVVYWRFHTTTADMVRVEVGLDGAVLSTISGVDAIDAEQKARDPIAWADAQLAARDVSARPKGISGLVGLSDPRIPGYVAARAVQDPTWQVRVAAVRALPSVTQDYVPTLCAALTGDKQRDVRVEVARYFRDHPTADAKPCLAKAAEKDPDPVVRSLAREAHDKAP